MNKSHVICMWASSQPVFPKYGLVEFTKSNLSVVVANVFGASIGCLMID